MSADKELMERVFDEVWSQGKYELLDEVVTDDYVDHDPANSFPAIRGPECLRTKAKIYRTAFSDLRFVIENQAQEGDVVTTRWTATGTHDGELAGIPATGRKVSVDGLSMTVVRDGKMAEGWSCWDTYGLLRQLEVLLAPLQDSPQETPPKGKRKPEALA